MSQNVVVPLPSISPHTQSAAAPTMSWSSRSSTSGHQKSSRNGQKPSGAVPIGMPWANTP